MPMETSSARILVVDDDAASRRLLEVRLRTLGCQVMLASDGEEALQIVDSLRPDIILLDYMMPKVTGIEVLKQLKEHERYKAIPGHSHNREGFSRGQGYGTGCWR